MVKMVPGTKVRLKYNGHALDGFVGEIESETLTNENRIKYGDLLAVKFTRKGATGRFWMPPEKLTVVTQ